MGPIKKAKMLKTPVPAVRWTAPSLVRGSANSLLVSARIPPTGGRVHPKLGKQGIKGANTFTFLGIHLFIYIDT